jgi:hypothetical protein
MAANSLSSSFARQTASSAGSGFSAIEVALTAVIVLGVILLIILLVREIVTWYWKINRMVELLESIDKNLQTQGKNINQSLLEVKYNTESLRANSPKAVDSRA